MDKIKLDDTFRAYIEKSGEHIDALETGMVSLSKKIHQARKMMWDAIGKEYPQSKGIPCMIDKQGDEIFLYIPVDGEELP